MLLFLALDDDKSVEKNVESGLEHGYNAEIREVIHIVCMFWVRQKRDLASIIEFSLDHETFSIGGIFVEIHTFKETRSIIWIISICT